MSATKLDRDLRQAASPLEAPPIAPDGSGAITLPEVAFTSVGHNMVGQPPPFYELVGQCPQKELIAQGAGGNSIKI